MEDWRQSGREFDAAAGVGLGDEDEWLNAVAVSPQAEGEAGDLVVSGKREGWRVVPWWVGGDSRRTGGGGFG